MARIQQKTSGRRIKREPLESESFEQAVRESLTRNGQPPKRWGEYLPRRHRKPASTDPSDPPDSPSSLASGL